MSSHLSFLRTDSPRSSDLLSRVRAVAELRERPNGGTVKIRPILARPPWGEYLEVSRTEGPFKSEFPVAVVDHVTPKVLEAFLVDIDAGYRRDDARVRSTLVYGGAPPPPDVRSKAAARHVLLQSYKEYQGLIDFSSYVKRQTERLVKDPLYPPSLYVEQTAQLVSGWDAGQTADALGELSGLLAAPLGRFILVLGDFGAGKTFLLHELARRLAGDAGGPIPILIELRSLEKAPEFESLIAYHLSRAGMERIDLPAFRHMLSQGQIVLLFDGFDELVLRISYAQAADHLSTLIQAAQGEAKVVITSRTQHFLSDRAVTDALTKQQVKLAFAEQASRVTGYRMMKLQPFGKEQIRRFLVKQLGNEG